MFHKFYPCTTSRRLYSPETADEHRATRTALGSVLRACFLAKRQEVAIPRRNAI